MSDNESGISSAPADPRCLSVPGPANKKLSTEDCTGATEQTRVSVNATGSNNPGLFITRPRTALLESYPVPSFDPDTCKITRNNPPCTPSMVKSTC